MSSPIEQNRSIMRRIIDLLRERIWEPIRTGARFVHLAVIFAPVLFTAPMVLVGSRRKKGGARWGELWWYRFLVAQMQRAGPSFIKLAQWAATRADLFPAALCERFAALHSNGKPHSFSHTKRTVEKLFGRPFDQVFESFDEVPIGTGAIAQVYRATLNPELLPNSYLDPKHTHYKHPPGPVGQLKELQGRLGHVSGEVPPFMVPTSSVAIKVLHPHVASTIRRDLAIMSFFATCLSVIPGIEWLSLSEEVDVFGRMMNEQLDLRYEAANLRTFEKNFAVRRSAVTFPRPLEEFSSHEVLVEEFQNALPLKAFLEYGGGPFDDRIANLGLDAFLNMMLLDNFVHSDLHPGNIMVKFYKPTTKFVIQSIVSSIFHTTPPSANLSPSDGPADHNSSTPTPSEESDAVVARLAERAKLGREEWLAELQALEKDGYQPSLVFIDAGLVTVLNEENRRNFLDLFRAIAEFDGYRAGTLMVERCRTPDLVVERETFALKIQHLVLGVKAKTFSLGSIKISDVLTQLLQSVRTHHVRMEGDFINTVLAILLLEGIGRQLDPGLDLFKSSLPILRQVGRQMAASDALSDMPRGNLGAMLKIWVWIEARELVSSAIVNIDDMIKYDWLSPSV